MKKIHIALDLDNTLAEYSGDISLVGRPIEKMMNKLRFWLASGYKVTIWTARVSLGDWHTKEGVEHQYYLIRQWLKENNLPELDITPDKKPSFTHFVDDKALRVIKDTGIIDNSPDELIN